MNKFGVVIFPGSNCDQDMIHVLRDIMGLEVEELWHKDADLKGCNFIILPGGFSYGDYLRSGAIARFSPIMEKVVEFANNGGHVMGICNGFQILCEAGLLPGALLHNNDRKFICKNVYIKADNNDTLITSEIPKEQVLKIPVAHGEGRFHAEEQTIKDLTDNGQILFRYCDETGEYTETANPNGTINNIAGVCNAGKNVFGMMPHPERATDNTLSNIDGRWIFDSIASLSASTT